MDRIDISHKATANPVAKATTNPVVVARNVKRSFGTFFIRNINSVLSLFIVLVVVFVFLAQVKILPNVSVQEAAASCVLLFFCSYFMYCNLLNSGTKLGKQEEDYINCTKKHNDLRETIKSNNYEQYLNDFCESVRKAKFIRDRETELSRVGILYSEYTEKYEGKTEEEILQEFPELNKGKRKAIKKANAVKCVAFTKEMIYRECKPTHSQAILGVTPQAKRNFRMVWNIFFSAVVAFMSYSIFVDVIEKPTWASFAMCLVKLLPLFVCGWRGFTNGFDFIAVESVSYMSDQNDLLEEAIVFAKAKKEAEPSLSVTDQCVPEIKEDQPQCLEDSQNPNSMISSKMQD